MSHREWYNHDEFRHTGHVEWDIPSGRENIISVFKLLRSTDKIYALSEYLDSGGVDKSLNAAEAILSMNCHFDVWSSAIGSTIREKHGYENCAIFFFRKQEDAAMFRMLWG
jgi:hypothetical protein